MRKVAVGVVGSVVLMCGSAFGGVATFNGAGQVVLEGSGTPVVMTIDVSTQTLSPGGFNGADIVIGSNDAAFSFAYLPAWTGAMLTSVSPPGPAGIYTHDFLVGGSNSSGVVGNTLGLGTITFQTAGLGVGDYLVQISSETDGFSELGRGLSGQTRVSETIFGVGRFSVVVPEPATLSLLGLGLVGLIRRRISA